MLKITQILVAGGGPQNHDQKGKKAHFDTETTTNYAFSLDTVIYNTNGTVNTNDDIAIMVLEDFSGNLTIDNFDII